MAKKISMQDLQEMSQRGAHVEGEDKPTEVIGIREIANQLAEMIEIHKQENEKKMKVLIAAVNKITNAMPKDSVDLSEVKMILNDIAESVRPEQPSYEFTIQRNSRNLITSVSAKPNTSTLQ